MGIRTAALNTFKISLAAMLAILIADRAGLANAVSAGIVAILTIQPTKRETIHTAIHRGEAFLIALLVSFLTFSVFGYNYQGFFSYIIIYIFICQRFAWISAMAMNSVIISHFLGFGEMTREYIVNEICIFLIGVGMGLISNLFLQKNTARMRAFREAADTEMKKILYDLSVLLRREDRMQNTECFYRLDDAIRLAENMAKINFENQLSDKDTYEIKYIEMRKSQRHVLMEMWKIVTKINGTPITLKRIADFLEKISREYNQNNTVEELLLELESLSRAMRETPLPRERREFEDRAQLYSLMKGMEEFLMIKADFMEAET